MINPNLLTSLVTVWQLANRTSDIIDNPSIFYNTYLPLAPHPATVTLALRKKCARPYDDAYGGLPFSSSPGRGLRTTTSDLGNYLPALPKGYQSDNLLGAQAERGEPQKIADPVPGAAWRYCGFYGENHSSHQIQDGEIRADDGQKAAEVYGREVLKK